MSKRSGVTLLVLSIILVIMTILLTVTVVSGTGAYNDAQKVKLQSEISQLEILVNNYITRNSVVSFDAVQHDISLYTEEEKAQFEGETIIDNKIMLYIIDLVAIDAHEVSYGMLKNGPKDRYLYSAVTKKVYYDLGRTIDQKIYHRIDKTEEK
jgi:Tfp pilus assembly protein PilE